MTAHTKLLLTPEQEQLLEALFSSWPLNEITQHQIWEVLMAEKEKSSSPTPIPGAKLINQWLRSQGAQQQLQTTWTLK